MDTEECPPRAMKETQEGPASIRRLRGWAYRGDVDPPVVWPGWRLIAQGVGGDHADPEPVTAPGAGAAGAITEGSGMAYFMLGAALVASQLYPRVLAKKVREG